MQKGLLTKIKALYANTQNNHGEGSGSRSIQIPTSHIRQDIKEAIDEYQSTSRLVTLLDTMSLREKYNDAVRMSSSLNNIMIRCHKSICTWFYSIIS